MKRILLLAGMLCFIVVGAEASKPLPSDLMEVQYKKAHELAVISPVIIEEVAAVPVPTYTQTAVAVTPTPDAKHEEGYKPFPGSSIEDAGPHAPPGFT